MRRKTVRCMVLLPAVALLLVCTGRVAVAAAEDEPEVPLVLALYYAHYDWVAWSQPYCDQPLGLYVSADVSAIERHVCQARDAGLDGLVQAWYGPSLADNPTAPNLDLLLDKASVHGIKVSVLLDMTGPFLRKPDDVAAALTTVRDQLTSRHAYLSMDGRPVVFFLGQHLFPLPVWESLRSGLDPLRAMVWIAEGPSTDSLAVFDGLYLYQPETRDPPGSLLPAHADAVRAWSRVYQTSRVWVATVMPGYDDSLHVDADTAWVRPRAGGSAYRESWAIASASDPDLVLIRSFNEWPACTQIEPSVRDDGSYLALTAELIAESREIVVEAPEPTATVESPVPTPTEASEPLTVTETLTATSEITITATPTPTPTETLLPTATPLRLSTPTPVIDVSAQPDAPDVTRTLQATALVGVSVAPQQMATSTPVPRMPVEGEGRPRCLTLPWMLVVGVCGGTWLRKRR